MCDVGETVSWWLCWVAAVRQVEWHFVNHKMKILFSHVVLFLYLFLLINIIIVWNIVRYILFEKYCNERISEQLKSNMIIIRNYQLSIWVSLYITRLEFQVYLSLCFTNCKLTKCFIAAFPNYFSQLCESRLCVALTWWRNCENVWKWVTEWLKLVSLLLRHFRPHQERCVSAVVRSVAVHSVCELQE